MNDDNPIREPKADEGAVRALTQTNHSGLRHAEPVT